MRGGTLHAALWPQAAALRCALSTVPPSHPTEPLHARPHSTPAHLHGPSAGRAAAPGGHLPWALCGCRCAALAACRPDAAPLAAFFCSPAGGRRSRPARHPAAPLPCHAGVSGAEFVRLSDGRLRELAAPGELPRVLRVLRAHEAFAEIDACGEGCACALPRFHRAAVRARLHACVAAGLPARRHPPTFTSPFRCRRAQRQPGPAQAADPPAGARRQVCRVCRGGWHGSRLHDAWRACAACGAATAPIASPPEIPSDHPIDHPAPIPLPHPCTHASRTHPRACVQARRGGGAGRGAAGVDGWGPRRRGRVPRLSQGACLLCLLCWLCWRACCAGVCAVPRGLQLQPSRNALASSGHLHARPLAEPAATPCLHPPRHPPRCHAELLAPVLPPAHTLLHPTRAAVAPLPSPPSPAVLRRVPGPHPGRPAAALQEAAHRQPAVSTCLAAACEHHQQPTARAPRGPLCRQRRPLRQVPVSSHACPPTLALCLCNRQSLYPALCSASSFTEPYHNMPDLPPPACLPAWTSDCSTWPALCFGPGIEQ